MGRGRPGSSLEDTPSWEQGHECILHDTGMVDDLVPHPPWESGSCISSLLSESRGSSAVLLRLGVEGSGNADLWDGHWVVRLEAGQFLPAC